MTLSLTAWDRTVKKLMLDTKEELAQTRTRVAREIYEFIIEGTPVWSGYLAANHQIMIGGVRTGRDFPRRPRKKKPWEPRGSFEFLIDVNVEAQLRKLEQDKGPFRKVIIGTSVPYAAKVGMRRLYNIAAGLATIRS